MGTVSRRATPEHPCRSVHRDDRARNGVVRDHHRGIGHQDRHRGARRGDRAAQAGRSPGVEVVLNSYSYRSTVAVMNGQHLIGVSAEVRQAASVQLGHRVRVTVTVAAPTPSGR